MEKAMRTAIITDTNSGLTRAAAAELGVYLLPMPVILDDRIYYEGETITEERFYAALTAGVPASTSQPSPGDVMELWDRALSEGYDQVVYIPMSSGLSQSCQAAIALSGEYGGRVYVADNHRISVTLKESVRRAAALAAEGADGASIKDILEREAYDASIYITVNTLEYLKKGGRITPAAALLGSILNIKPVLTIQGGKLDAFAKARGRKKCEELMVQALKKDAETRFAGRDSAGMRLCAAGTALTEEEVAQMKEALGEVFPGVPVEYDPLSISIGCHTGPGAMGMAICF